MIKAAANQNPPVFGFDCVCLIKGILVGLARRRVQNLRRRVLCRERRSGYWRRYHDYKVQRAFQPTFPMWRLAKPFGVAGISAFISAAGWPWSVPPPLKTMCRSRQLKTWGQKSGYNARTWTKHGKLPYIEYDNAAPVQPDKPDTGAGAGGAIKAGSVVRVKQGAKTYTGGGLASFVYERDHVVSELNGDRAVITYGGVTVAAVRVSDLVLADGSGAGGTIKAGSVVRVKQGAKTYTGGGLASFVYSRDHVVSELNGDRAVITYGGVTVAAVRVSDLTLVKE